MSSSSLSDTDILCSTVVHWQTLLADHLVIVWATDEITIFALNKEANKLKVENNSILQCVRATWIFDMQASPQSKWWLTPFHAHKKEENMSPS